MRTIRSFLRLFVLCLITPFIVVPPSPSFAGTLSDFEKQSTEKRSTDRSSSKDWSNASQETDSLDEAAGQCIGSCLAAVLAPLFSGMAVAGSLSMSRIDTSTPSSEAKKVPTRLSGEALIPFFRFDLSYQDVKPDVSAWDYRIEAGYGSVGFQARRSVYTERNPRDTLETRQYHALYRMSLDKTLEIDGGLGVLEVRGQEDNTGLSITVPVLYHPSEHYGLELRPAWSSINANTISDIDLALVLGLRYASLRVGYRLVRSRDVSLDGPYTGVALRW